MAQTGFTPIITYHSTTGSAVPSNSNLSPGELALNIADMKLYCENSSGTVTLLASGDAAAGNFTTVDTTNIEVTNIKAKDGTAAVVLTDSTGAVAVSTPLTANGGVVFNEAGADVDFRVEGDTDANLLFVDASANAVGIRTSSPASDAGLTVGGASGNSRIVVRRTNASVSAGNNFLELQAQNSSLDVVGTLAFRRDTADDDAYCAISTRPTGGAVTERMRITSAGEVLVGGTTSISSTNALTIERASNAILNLYRSGTSILNGSILGTIDFYGADTTSNTPTRHAYINAVASGTHAAGDNPTDLTFGTTPDGSATVAEKMRLDQAGNLLVGTTSAPTGASNSIVPVASSAGLGGIVGGTILNRIYRADEAAGTLTITLTGTNFSGTLDVWVSGGFNTTNREGYAAYKVIWNRTTTSVTTITVKAPTNTGGSFTTSYTFTASKPDVDTLTLAIGKPSGAFYIVGLSGQVTFLSGISSSFA